MKTGIELIAEERQRQMDVEGWSAEHDALYTEGQLADAAYCYLTDPDHRDYAPFPWPWANEWWKPTPYDRVRELQKAGALIAAEIDRLQNRH